jgi:hypothetical protein
VIHGTAELTEGMDITPSMREDNVARLKNGLDDGQRSLKVTSDTYTHVLIDSRELDYTALLTRP